MKNFNLLISTTNGTGSQSANNVILKSLFRSDYHISGKNLFPSNISGLPTSYALRISESQSNAYQNHFDLLIAMNPNTIESDLEKTNSGGALIYNSNLKLKNFQPKADIEAIGVPFKDLAKAVNSSPAMVKFLTNMVYVGVFAKLARLPLETIKSVVSDVFANKPAIISDNLTAIESGYSYTAENIDLNIELPTSKTKDRTQQILIDGNTAGAIGLLYGGCNFMSWYPITPSSSLAEGFIKYSNKYNTNNDGKSNFTCIQAEDELSAISMVIGAGWAGARSVTPTSGPGLSLMAEAAGLSYFAEIPAVIWNVQRAGPSTGLPTRTLQGDLLAAYHLSHGDTEHIVIIPGTPDECFSFAEIALNLSETFQTLVIVLTDLDLGMNNWVSDELKCNFSKWEKGKVLNAEDLEKVEKFNRYEDLDNDGICYRTLPGTPHDKAGYFSRGTGHDIDASYSESPEVFENLLNRLKKKINNSASALPQAEIQDEQNEMAILCYGSSHPACFEAIEDLKSNHSMALDFMRIKALPFSEDTEAFISSHKKTFVIDLNRDGQMHGILLKKFPHLWDKLESITHFNGLPIDAKKITGKVLDLTSPKSSQAQRGQS